MPSLKMTAQPRSHALRGNAVRTLRVRECLKDRDTDRQTAGTRSVRAAFPRRAWERGRQVFSIY
ncbi:MAG: hypothetical protein GY749_41495 [Desulfobacteraceae bacterium]|nr:hypothetical protein [Desulfobacteraceae bacterium]